MQKYMAEQRAVLMERYNNRLTPENYRENVGAVRLLDGMTAKLEELLTDTTHHDEEDDGEA